MDSAADAKKADKTGVYKVTIDGVETHMRFKEGAVLPDGAKYRDAGKPIESPMQEQQESIRDAAEKRAKGAAPENRAQ